MNTVINLDIRNRPKLPEQFQGDDDVRYTEELVELFLSEYTKEGDTVFDPFAGFGTTLIVCDRMKRIGYGVEFDEKRCRFVQSLLKDATKVIHGDSTKLKDLDFPPIQFSITSPPYMGRHHKENPFTSYSTIGKGYEHYLDTLQSIYIQVKDKMVAGARAVIEVSNLKHDDAPLTTLAWDIANKVSSVLEFEGEIVVNWDGGYGFGYQHSYCLVFRKNA